jgi:hypothetical protein
MPSLQVGALQTLFAQLRLVQSLPTRHFPPFGHAAHAVPPQSTSVSLPFLTPSPQPGCVQVPPEQ